jgi:hypothetical protein
MRRVFLHQLCNGSSLVLALSRGVVVSSDQSGAEPLPASCWQFRGVCLPSEGHSLAQTCMPQNLMRQPQPPPWIFAFELDTGCELSATYKEQQGDESMNELDTNGAGANRYATLANDQQTLTAKSVCQPVVAKYRRPDHLVWVLHHILQDLVLCSMGLTVRFRSDC